MKHTDAILACATAAALVLAGCGSAGAPSSTRTSTPPATRPDGPSAARYLAGVAAPLGTWAAAMDTASASLRAAAGLAPGGGRQSAAAPVAALGRATRHSERAVRGVDVPGSLHGAQAALLRSLVLTERGSRAVEQRIRDWPFPTVGPTHRLGPAARAVGVWARALAGAGGRTPVPAWVPQLASSAASLARSARAALAPQAIAPDAAGAAVAALQRRLAALRYLPPGYVTGSDDARTMHAVIAFQGWEGLTRDGVAGPVTLSRLAGAAAPRPWSTAGRHLEIHKAQQVLLLVDAGSVLRAIHVSTAAPGHVTPDGTFTIYRKELMSWSVPFQVWMPYASYFWGGYALHEYPDVPPYPASHGCVRVPSAEAIVVWDFATIGTPLIVG